METQVLTHTSTQTKYAPALTHGCLNMADVSGEDLTVFTLTLSLHRELQGKIYCEFCPVSHGVQSSGMVLGCLVWCGEKLLNHSPVFRAFQIFSLKTCACG